MNFCGSRTRRCGRPAGRLGAARGREPGQAVHVNEDTGETQWTHPSDDFRRIPAAPTTAAAQLPDGAGTSGAGVVGLHLDGRAGAGRRRRDAVHPDAGGPGGRRSPSPRRGAPGGRRSPSPRRGGGRRSPSPQRRRPGGPRRSPSPQRRGGAVPVASRRGPVRRGPGGPGGRRSPSPRGRPRRRRRRGP